MPRRKRLAVVQPESSAVPDHIRDTRIWQKRTITKRKMASFNEAMLLINTPELSRKYFASLHSGLPIHNKTSMDHTGRMLGYQESSSGVNITVAQQMVAQNAAAGVDSPVMGFDAFIRQQAELRGQDRTLPQPQTIDVQPETGE